MPSFRKERGSYICVFLVLYFGEDVGAVVADCKCRCGGSLVPLWRAVVALVMP